jgi:uncharacterized protein
MSSGEERIEITSEAFAAFGRGDIESVLSLADPDVEVFVPSTLPNAGTYRGHAGYLQWIGQWLEAWEAFRVDVVAMTPVGRRHVVADTHQQGVGRGSGIPVEQDMIYMTDVRDGRVVAIHLYPTRDEAMAAAEERERFE